ncbi:MAG: class IV adenylate cyclase [Anaerococcus vaginalis]|uniref:CYTH domain protein n=1 Tax=Anaerococcus vaginalis TaxID=33037 RepID=A0A6N2RN12_9FIRM
MDRELEIKVLNINIEEIEEKLKDKGAEFLGVEIQKNHTFAPKNAKEFSNGYLRIREKTVDDKREATELTFKEVVDNKDNIRVNNEYTTTINSTSNMIKILEEIGLVERYVGDKKRISYNYRGQRFDIDIWSKDVYPDPYMEIEFTNVNLMEEILDEFEIDRKNVTNESINELIEKRK